MDDETKTTFGYDPFASGGRDRWGRQGEGNATLPEIPNYAVIDLLGSGGMGTVWSARYIPLDQPRAIKVLRRPWPWMSPCWNALAGKPKPRPIGTSEHRQGLRRFDDPGVHIAMDFVGGKNPRRNLQDSELSQDEALKYIGQIAEALDYAHGMGFIHRDIKRFGTLSSVTAEMPRLSTLGLPIPAATAKTQQDHRHDAIPVARGLQGRKRSPWRATFGHSACSFIAP